MQHTVGFLHIKTAAGARLGQTLGGQHLVGRVHGVDADPLLRGHGAAAGQRRAGGALAGAYLVRKGGVKLLIQRGLFIRLQFYHTVSPNWPHKKFKNWAFIQSQSLV